ncbi:hypothetical protein RIF29_33634 [Crotalaria pallida]|uniref:Uncharacterized protein n=1 Tax=Crotalaria pallida TaxID=3830 RepID=A0AAN9EDV1_CROPI
MARKRGRPPKTPVTQQKETHEDASERSEPIPMDLQALEDADFENLGPKKTQEILVCLDALHAKLTGKGSDEAAKDENTNKEDPKDSQGERGNIDSNGTVPTQEPFKVPNVWENFDITKLRNAGEKKDAKQQWVVKKRPTQEEVNKVAETLKTKQAIEAGTIPVENVESALEDANAVLQTVTNDQIDKREAEIRDKIEDVQKGLDLNPDDASL